jgi:hypothetical protein
MSVSLPSFEAAFSQSETYNLPGPGFQAQSDNFEAMAGAHQKLPQAFSYSDRSDRRLPTTVLNEEFDLGITRALRYAR